MVDQDKKAQTRAKAYHLWEKEGRPHGRALDHWLEAEQHEHGGTARSQPTEGEPSRTEGRAFDPVQSAAARSEPPARKARAAKPAAEGKTRKRPSRGQGTDPETKD